MEGFTRNFTPQSALVVDTAAYATGDLIGTKMTFDISGLRDAQAIYLQSVQIRDQAKQSAAMDLVLFSADPAATTFTDNAQFDIADADMDKIATIVAASSFYSFNDNGIARAENLARALNPNLIASSVKLYGALVSRGTPTFVASTDVNVTLSLCG